MASAVASAGDVTPFMQPLIKRSLGGMVLQRFPAISNPQGLYRWNVKHPDGASIVQWKGGKVLMWDATCPETLALSYTNFATKNAGSVVEETERKKRAKYSHLEASHHFVPVRRCAVTGVFLGQRRSPSSGI